jgi:superfamily II DNA or RNA helicase
VDDIRARLREGSRRILLVAPTGAGKGTLATYIIQSAGSRGKRVLFLVNRRELVKDLSRRLDRLGLDHGVIMGNHPRRKPWLNVHVASIDTLHRREHLPPADLMFVDEAHFSLSPIWLKVLARYPGVPLIGMTATPIRLDGRGLGHVFQSLVECPTLAELTGMGYLVPTRVFAPPSPDVAGVHTTAGDYNQKELSAAVDLPTITGDIVQHWLKLARGRPTVVFAVDIRHSQHLAEQFQAAGVRAVHADANTPDEVRDRLWEDLAAYRTEVVCSVGIVSYGWDCPPVSCGVLARPTQSMALYLQQCGRILRVAPGKSDALILDHAGNTLRHGFVDDPREWSLDDAEIKARSKDKDDPGLAVRMCKKCWFAFSIRLTVCPECGWEYIPTARDIQEKDGELREIKPERWYFCEGCRHKGRLPDGATLAGYACPRCQTGPLVAMASKYDTPDQSRRIEKLLEWHREAQARGYKRSYAQVMFKQLYGQWPRKEWLQQPVGQEAQPQEATA